MPTNTIAGMAPTREFGDKHHTTVLHSVHKIEELLHHDRDLSKQIQIFMDSFK